MVLVEVLDTAALISWPVERLAGGVVLNGQRREVERIEPERLISLDVADLLWATPNQQSLSDATGIAMGTGDIAGISEVDLGLLALAIEKGGRLYTDDYRLQNLCKVAGVDWRPIETDGITAAWNWEVRCTGCGERIGLPEKTTHSRGDLGSCKTCGSSLKVRRIR
jgi:UPF0271 protein